jgi:hypothetical protein
MSHNKTWMNKALDEAKNHEFNLIPPEFAIELVKNDSDIKFQELNNRTRTDSGGFLVVEDRHPGWRRQPRRFLLVSERQ